MKRTQLVVGIITLAITLSLSAVANAQGSESSASASGTTTATTRVPKTLSPKWAFSYVSFFTGPPVSDLRSDETAAARDGFSLGLALQNQLGVRYWLTDQLSVTPVFDFEYQLTDPHKNNTSGVALVYDSFIKTKYVDALKGYIENNKLSVDLEARYYVPVSEFSRENGSYGSIRLAAIPGLDVPDTNLQISVLTYYRYWMQTNFYQVSTRYNIVPKNTVGLPEHTFYIGPQINYRISKTFNAWLLYEQSHTIDTLGFASTSDPRRSHSDIEPGIDIRLMNGVYISPYLNWYTNQPIETTSVNLITSITI